MPLSDRMPPGMEECPAGEPILVSRSGKRRWWRCPTCRWVGWVTRSDRPPNIAHHRRVRQM